MMKQPIITQPNKFRAIPLVSLSLVATLLMGAGCESSDFVATNTANDNNENATTLENTNATITPALEINAPNGEETVPVNEEATIIYSISDSLQTELTPDDVVELYLLDNQGVVAGYIGEVTDYAATTYSWKPDTLQHWAGLDTTVNAPDPGRYRILLVARPRAVEPTNANTDEPVDLLVDSNTRYDGEALWTMDDNPRSIEVIAVDTSDDLFEIVPESER